MRKKFGFNIRKKQTEMDLNITAMADIMVVLIVFVLKATTTDLMDVSVSTDLNLPSAETKDKVEEIPRVEISKSTAFINGKKIIQISPSGILELGQKEVMFIIQELKNFDTQKKRDISAESNKKILILADEFTAYDAIKKIMDVTQLQGYSNYKFVTIKNEGQ